MKKRQHRIRAGLLLFVIGLLASGQSIALTGTTKLACEALLCLSSGERPSECAQSLRRYFSISPKRLKDIIKERGNFLKLCPSSDASLDMKSLVHAVVRGAGRCSAKDLNGNRVLGSGMQSCPVAIMPSYCKAYHAHTLTDLNKLPTYTPPPPPNNPWGGLFAGSGGGMPGIGSNTSNFGGMFSGNNQTQCGHWSETK